MLLAAKLRELSHAKHCIRPHQNLRLQPQKNGETSQRFRRPVNLPLGYGRSMDNYFRRVSRRQSLLLCSRLPLIVRWCLIDVDNDLCFATQGTRSEQ